MSTRKAAITGGSGFLARKLTDALCARGYEVQLLVRSPQKAQGLMRSGVSICGGDLADKKALEKLCDGVDVVFHTAGMISYNPAKAQAMYETNVLGTKAIAEAALHCGVKRLVHTSSTAAIGVNEDPHVLLDEQSPFNARKLGMAYFDTKYDAEQELLQVVGRGLDAVMVNPGSILGPGDTRRYEKGYAGLIYKYNPPVLFHGGINFVDVEDVVAGHLLAMENGRKGERYILGGENLGFGELIVRVNGLLGRPSSKKYVPRSLMGLLAVALRGLNALGLDIHMTPELVKQVCDWYLFVDSSKAKRELGYAPRKIDQCMLDTIDWLKKEGRLK